MSSDLNSILDIPASEEVTELTPILKELQESNSHLSGIKWAVRGVGLLLAIIVIFGAKINLNQ